MPVLGFLLGGPQGRIIALCVLSLIAFCYSWWNERTRERPSMRQKRVAQGLIVLGLVGSLLTTIWASIDAARDAQQRDEKLSNAQSLALKAAEHSNVATLSPGQQRRVTNVMQRYAHLKSRITCFPGASEFCKPLISALQAAQLDLKVTLTITTLADI